MSAISNLGTGTAFLDDASLYSYPGSLLDPAGSLGTAAAPGLFDQAKTALAGAGPALSVFGLISGAVGSFYSAKSQQSSLQFQADMSRINARAAEQQAQSILDVGQKQVGEVTLRAGRLKSAQRVAFAANGISLGGSPTVDNVLTTTDYFKESDALTISANATRAAWAARTQSTNYSNQANMQSSTASQISPWAAGAAGLLTGAGQLASYAYPRRIA